MPSHSGAVIVYLCLKQCTVKAVSHDVHCTVKAMYYDVDSEL